jgi:hypothetical protein
MNNSTKVTITKAKKTVGLDNYVKIIQELKSSGLLDLNRLHELSYVEKNDIFQEILRWSVFGKCDLKKLKTTPPEHNIKI